MNKIQEIIKPFLCILLGALLFFYYLNFLSNQGSMLAIGIIAIVVASFYLAFGILNVTAGDKLPIKLNKVLSLISVVAFPIFAFIAFLLFLIELSQVNGAMGPNGWVVCLIGIISSISFASLYIIQSFAKSSVLRRISFLLASIFALALLLNCLFDFFGDPLELGKVDLVYLLIDILYVFMLFDIISSSKKQVA